MANGLNTQRESAQFKGPLTSDKYNQRQEDIYRDLQYGYNKTAVIEDAVVRSYQRLLKNQYSAEQRIKDLEARLAALETVNPTIVFSNPSNDDTARFVGTPYEVSSDQKCFEDTRHGILVLPKIDVSSVSKISFVDSDGTISLPSSLDVFVSPNPTTADNDSAMIDSSAVENAFLNQVGAIWERNVVTSNPNPNSAVLSIYIRIPDELSTTSNTNNIVLHPFPVMGCDILGVYYSTKNDITLSESDGYVPVNSASSWSNNHSAVGWSAPGAWDGDQILGSGPKSFYFNPQQVTAIKITLRQPNYYVDSGRFVYTYGMSSIDIRDDKFADTGRILLRVDAPTGQTISHVNSVTPEIWNVSETELLDVFSYRTIWETSFNSGVYSLNPVALSKRVWIDVTLNATASGGTPAVSGLVLNYS